jgi:hypothetical protein
MRGDGHARRADQHEDATTRPAQADHSERDSARRTVPCANSPRDRWSVCGPSRSTSHAVKTFGHRPPSEREIQREIDRIRRRRRPPRPGARDDAARSPHPCLFSRRGASPPPPPPPSKSAGRRPKASRARSRLRPCIGPPSLPGRAWPSASALISTTDSAYQSARCSACACLEGPPGIVAGPDGRAPCARRPQTEAVARTAESRLRGSARRTMPSPIRARRASSRKAMRMPSGSESAERTIAVLTPRPTAPPAIWHM